jgi:hypothetical protein
MRTLLATALAAIAAAGLAAGIAQADPLPPDMVAAAKAYDAARLQGDRAELKRLIADDYLLQNTGDGVKDKAAVIAEATDPDIRLAPAVVQQRFEEAYGGETAVRMGVTTLSGTNHGKAFSSRVRFTDIWALRKGAWVLAATQIVTLPAR